MPIDENPEQYRRQVQQRTAALLTGERPRNPRLSHMSTGRLIFEAVVEELKIYRLRKQEQVRRERVREARRMERRSRRRRVEYREEGMGQRRARDRDEGLSRDRRGRGSSGHYEIRRREDGRGQVERERSGSWDRRRRRRRTGEVRDIVVEGAQNNDPAYMATGGAGPSGTLATTEEPPVRRESWRDGASKSKEVLWPRLQDVGPDGQTPFGELPRKAAGVGFLAHFKNTYRHIKSEHVAGQRERSAVETIVDGWRGKEEQDKGGVKVMETPDRSRGRQLRHSSRGFVISRRPGDLRGGEVDHNHQTYQTAGSPVAIGFDGRQAFEIPRGWYPGLSNPSRRMPLPTRPLIHTPEPAPGYFAHNQPSVNLDTHSGNGIHAAESESVPVTPHYSSPRSPVSDEISDINLHQHLPPPAGPNDEAWSPEPWSPLTSVEPCSPKMEEEQGQYMSSCGRSGSPTIVAGDEVMDAVLIVAQPVVRRKPLNSPSTDLTPDPGSPESSVAFGSQATEATIPATSPNPPPVPFLTARSDTAATDPSELLHDITSPRRLRKVRSSEKRDRSAAWGAGQVIDTSSTAYEETRHSHEVEERERAQSANRAWDETEWVDHDEENDSRRRRVLEHRLQAQFGGGHEHKVDATNRLDESSESPDNKVFANLSAHIGRLGWS